MTITRTALDREMLLVPAPEVALEVPGDTQVRAQATQLQQEFDATGHLAEPPPARPKVLVVRLALMIVALLCIGTVVQLGWVSGLQHRSSQVSLYNQFRTELALGTAPIGPQGTDHGVTAPGVPMALLRIPSIGVSQVVVEGTTGSELAKGPGHYRSTVFPGGAGDSVVLGRAAAFGGPFARISDLRKGARITVVTGVGTSVFRVVDIRHAGAEQRPMTVDQARLTLGTASGTAFVPSGVVWVDAEKVGAPLASYKPKVHSVPASERPLGIDTSTLWALSLWLVSMAALFAAAVWTWRRRGHAQAWIVFTAPIALVWLLASDQIARLLPNLL